ncbi:outer membrane protein OmpA-like peptidoglycan-associated protein [Thermonema lapsum]|uniref:Outer membrane protein OmpA-like peptidoglycan-associated protein n=1 Tax=Thermonema lapsum TaxID=28195 RepID=A0A846MN88_9BACT|nr:OmpA family protein [Thermonema lapsum]NIK72827.1 outer membrane protein OmpA-like peptidoglycan-associated protein [Thermonema lapsum]
MSRLKPILSLLLLCFCCMSALAQYEEGDKLLSQGLIDDALKSYLRQYKGNQKNDVQLLLRIGKAFLMQYEANKQQKALEYLETAHRIAPQEANVAYYYAEALMKHKRFDEAAQIAKEGVAHAKEARLREQLQKRHEGALLAKKCYASPEEIFIENAGKPINSKENDLAPVVATDDNHLIYSRQVFNNRLRVWEEQVYMAVKQEYVWKQSIPLAFPGISGSVRTAALSPDGQHLYLYIYDLERKGELYECRFDGSTFTTPTPLPEPINSPYEESSMSITADGNWLFFASDRPSGYGGKDIYVCYKNPDGSWSEPENLGPQINTPFDEEAPFIHPDKRHLYFTSNGHPTLGGKDIFRAERSGNVWGKVQNMGYPLNTPFDDGYFVLSADGKKGYFSSNRPEGIGQADLYIVGFPDESKQVIPLTMIRGRILAGDPPLPVKAQIKVIDKEKNEYLPWVYNPNPGTGYYLMIFPPGKDYDMVIEAEGYLPYLVNINVPNQEYFYELYQEIRLSKKVVDDREIAEQISITNVFKDVPEEKRNPDEFGEQKLDLYDLMEDIIASEDSVAMNYLLSIMYKDAPLMEPVQNEKVDKKSVEVVFFYEDAKGQMQEIKVGDETLKTMPRIRTDVASLEEDYSGNQGKIELKKKYVAYFPVGEARLDNRAKAELLKFIDYVKKHPEVGVWIEGYASPEGESEKNQILSEERAKAVYDFFVEFGVEPKRIRYKGMGNQRQDSSVARRLMRRTDVMLLPLNELKNQE